MYKNNKIISWIFCLTFLLSVLSGCGNQEEAPPEPVTVKSFKIEKAEAKKPVADSPLSEKSGDTPTVDRPAADETKTETPPLEQPEKSDETVAVSDEKGKKEEGAQPVEESPAVPEKDLDTPVSTLPELGLGATDDGESTGAYDPKGRIDPFEPLFKAKAETEVRESKGKSYKSIRESRRGKLTPLEKLDLSQLKLTAIILSPHRNIAMVQESTGKGHVIKKGTYIGINSGRVVEIKKNVVIIEEEVEDYLGNIGVRKRELKLQKPLGER